MKILRFLLLMCLISTGSIAQQIKTDTLKSEIDQEDTDTILGEIIMLEEVIVSKNKLDDQAKRDYLILQNRVYKVYPYAKIAAERLTMLNRNMAKLKTKKEKKKYFKIVEDYIENEFTGKLKKLSRKQGQILVKLINRQTGNTTYDLIKEYKSGWKAFWSSNTAKLFDINLKAKYDPYRVNEDYLIETILIRAFDSGRLPRQAAAKPVDYDEVAELWERKAAELKKKPQQ
ncbi:MAG TPA: DUF4294 domain-containing protein [Flavobacterium sp.]|jgi:hypothetical protein